MSATHVAVPEPSEPSSVAKVMLKVCDSSVICWSPGGPMMTAGVCESLRQAKLKGQVACSRKANPQTACAGALGLLSTSHGCFHIPVSEHQHDSEGYQM
jgi:hypothetical protein